MYFTINILFSLSLEPLKGMRMVVIGSYVEDMMSEEEIDETKSD